MNNRSLWLASILGLFLLAVSEPAEARGGSAANTVAKIVSQSHGRLSASWWKYVSSFPLAESPLQDQGEVDCTRGQNGPVIFLAGTIDGATAERSCTVPRRPLFFPLINVVFDNFVGEPPLTVEEKRGVLDGLINDTDPGPLVDSGLPGSRVCRLFATLDGEPLSFSTTIARAQSPPFLLRTEPDAFPPSADDPEAVSDGFWVLLPALSRGEHTLHFGASFCEFDTFEVHPAFGSVDVTYQLTVR